MKVAEGVWEFGVHIADVAHFVKPGMAVDKMAKFEWYIKLFLGVHFADNLA